MSAHISYLFTDEAAQFSNKIKTEFITNIEDLTRIIYNKENASYEKNDITVINEAFKTKNVNVLAGGRHVLFVWVFKPFNKMKYVIKPFKLNLAEIYLYYLSTRRFKELYNNLEIKTDSYSLNVKVMEIYCLGKITLKSNTYPFIIQEYSKGNSFKESKNKQIKLSIDVLRTLFIDIAKNGFVVDPFPSNWCIIPPKYNICPIVEYLDLIFFNDPVIKQEANQFLKNSSFHEYDYEIKVF